MFPQYASQRMRKVVTMSLAFGLVLAALALVIARQTDAHVLTAHAAPALPPVITQTYVIAATGPSLNNTSVHLSGPNGAGTPLQVIGGGVYGGDGGYIQNVYVNGNPPPPVDFVGGCTGTCSISGNAVINFNAMPVPIPTLYNIADFQPGGVYAVAAGSHYHSYSGDQSFTGVMAPGLYYVDGNVTLQNVTGTVSIVTTGDISINGGLGINTYDARFPLLFTSSLNTASGAIGAHNPNLDLTGDFFAPNGVINISGAQGSLRGRVYAKDIAWDASPATITCLDCVLWQALSLQKSVTPTGAVPHHGVVTYTSVLRNRDLVGDTYALFTDTLPAGVTFGQWIEQPISGVVQNGDSITWTGTISASTGITFTFTATHVSGYGDVITNTAYFSCTTYTGSANAVFTVEPINYVLTVSYAGNGSGQVMLNPSGPSYAANIVVTLTAVPTIASQFSGWSGDVISTINPAIVTMDSDKTITAAFVTHRIYLPLIFK